MITKKTILFLATILSTSFVFGQNTFPPDGNVGIGTTTPISKFYIVDINGGIFFNGTNATYNRFKSTTVSPDTGKDLLFTAQSAGTNPYLYIDATPVGRLNTS